MTESFRCPSCSAPLEFEGKMMQKCKFCNSSVIVPSGVIQNSSSFGSFGEINFGDLSSLTGKALKIAEIQKLLQSGNKIGAIKVFRETFGVGFILWLAVFYLLILVLKITLLVRARVAGPAAPEIGKTI